MRIRVLFFGATADEANSRVADIFLDDNADVENAFHEVQKRFPRLKDRQFLFSVNEVYVDGKRELCDGDEVAIFTYVSGG